MLRQLWHSFHEGGWAMYLIFALGLTGVGASGRFAWRGEHQLLGFLRWLVVTVFACGWFGFFIGMQRVLGAVTSRAAEDRVPGDLASIEWRSYILFEGTREALSCVSGALLFVIVMCLLAAVGHRRFPQPNPGSVAR
jgi:hypothetical protein